MTQPILFMLAAALAGAFILIPLARLIPLYMMREWRESMIDEGHAPAAPLVDTDFVFSFTHKIGRCFACGLLGYMAASIYPSIPDAAAIGMYLLGVLLLLAINMKHQLLPDQVVLTLLWLGLMRGAGSEHLVDNVLGAMVGYAVPWIALSLLRLVTGSEFLGRGDLKALAMAGAWIGAAKLPLIFIVFIAAVLLMMVLEALLKRRNSFGTGCAHLAASLAAVMLDSSSLDWIKQ